MLTTPATASAPYILEALSLSISMLSRAALGIELRSTKLTPPVGGAPSGYGARRRPSRRTSVLLASNPRKAIEEAPAILLLARLAGDSPAKLLTDKLRSSSAVVRS